jgi:hypothetical protein
MVVINFFDTFYSKLPKLGSELRHFIVSILPFLALFFGALIAFASIMDIVGTPFLNLFSSEGSGVFQRLMLVSVIGIFEGLLMLFSFRPLRKKQKKGWNLLFWSQILWIISALITISPSFILGFLFLYPLFQVRDSYR